MRGRGCLACLESVCTSGRYKSLLDTFGFCRDNLCLCEQAETRKERELGAHLRGNARFCKLSTSQDGQVRRSEVVVHSKIERKQFDEI